MSALIKQACEHWRYVAPLLSKPANEEDYDALVEALDELLAIVGDDEDHPLASLASHMGDMLLAYDEAHRPLRHAPLAIHGTTAGGDDGWGCRQVGQHFIFQGKQCLDPGIGDDGLQRLFRMSFNQAIGVHKRPLQIFSQPMADGTFAGARHADQGDGGALHHGVTVGVLVAGAAFTTHVPSAFCRSHSRYTISGTWASVAA